MSDMPISFTLYNGLLFALITGTAITLLVKVVPLAWRRRRLIAAGAVMSVPVLILQSNLGSTLEVVLALALGLFGIGMLAGFSAASLSAEDPAHPVVAGLWAASPYPLLSLLAVYIVSLKHPGYASLTGWGGSGGEIILLSTVGSPFIFASAATGGALAGLINKLRRVPPPMGHQN